MKLTALVLVVFMAIAGSAFAADTSVTAAAKGSFPSGTNFNGISISGLQIAAGDLIWGDGSGAEGKLTIALIGTTPLGLQQTINLNADVTGAQRTSANVVVISGTGTLDMGDGTAAVTVPVIATITTDSNNLGTVGLTIGATTLPASTIGDGSMAIDDLTP